MAWEIDTSAKRSRLAVRKNPYWCGVGGGRGGVSLGYRRRQAEAGTWVAKIVVDGKRAEERIGIADDASAPPDAIGYRAAVALALEWSVRQHASLEASAAADTTRRPTVRTAVEEYAKERVARTKRDGRICEGRLKKHVLSDKQFADIRLSKLQASMIEEWRGRLLDKGSEDDNAESIVPSTMNRLLNDLRAALNRAGLKHRRELPASFTQEVRLGTKAVESSFEARRQLLTDEQVRSVVEAAFEVDDSGDFGRLAVVLAATGARHSQVAALGVVDLQVGSRRVMMPGSKKGRGRKQRPSVPIPLSTEAIERLAPAVEGRDLNEPLLMRWHHRKEGKCTWVRAERRSWGPAYQTGEYWRAAVKRAGLPKGTIMYALRHSSIVRGLRAMLPVRLVAALHDTSVEMIEMHYAAFIVDATEDLARRAAISFAPEAAGSLRTVA